jgi:phytoene dehydrogenase-like protein
MQYDSIIIGAGMSGLAAGIRLAHFGQKVCILEKHFREGGLNSYFSRAGYELETGLHAMTNFAPAKGAKALPLSKLLRQLRIPHESLMLREQNYSKIVFPSATLRFNNDFELLLNEVSQKFPSEIDGFVKLNEYIKNYNEVSLTTEYIAAKKVIAKFIKDELLIDMIICPLMYYGSAVEDDMDFSQFVIMYKSIYYEGFCRPAGDGVRQVLNKLLERYDESGGELRLSTGVERIIAKDNSVSEVVTTNGESLYAKNILSSIGNIETLKLCNEQPDNISDLPTGELGYIESIAILEDYLDDYDNDETIIFFSNSDKFKYAKPNAPASFDSGVICFPHNFQFSDTDKKPPKAIRVTGLANYEHWLDQDPNEYKKMKMNVSAEYFKCAEKITGVLNIEQNAKLLDTMTPKTIQRFTGHIHGSIYGSPFKVKQGTTHLDNLFICGTDQGFLGITGAMLSGISMANLHMLR